MWFFFFFYYLIADQSSRWAPIRLKAKIAFTAFCQRLLITYRFSFLLSNSRSSCFTSLLSHWWLRHCVADILNSFLFISRFLINPLASSEILSKLSSSKSNSAIVTLAMVCTSVSPMNGDRPDNLGVSVVDRLEGGHSTCTCVMCVFGGWGDGDRI